ncbi:MAG: potassium-transporting ATPase subunit KdpA [Deltaproteobacteria bacterium]|nr:potassium-transporting ATPase subunit KdpA [Deltaproteobacteria bacterium]
MTGNALAQVGVFLALLVLFARPLGGYIAKVAKGERHRLSFALYPIERLALRALGLSSDPGHPPNEMTWKRYAASVLIVSGVGIVLLVVLQLAQGSLPLNPHEVGAPTFGVSLNTAVSFVTNTNWQTYAGESSLSPLTQMLGLATQNFLSAATGIAVLFALIRGFSKSRSDTIGNFWVDFVRVTVHVLLPLAFILALILVTQGVVQTFDTPAHVTTLEGSHQTLALGPVASQVAIKQLGTNGGGYFNVNSAHPLENPNALSNLLQCLAILLIPAALCFTFGHLVSDRRQGRALIIAMFAVFVPFTLATVAAEQTANPRLDPVALDTAPSELQPGGNMEGKEARFGITDSALWATATTAASNGSVNAMHDSMTPLGGLFPMVLMQLGEVIFGGVGSGLYGLIVFAILAVFAAGLMVGRTPEYLGKKIEVREMQMASLAILLPAAMVLCGTALAVMVPEGRAATANPGAHGFSEILYALSSGANNNGSAFGGLTANGDFFAHLQSLAMLVGRFGVLVPVLAIAGSLAKKQAIPASTGTLPTHGPLFIGLLVGVVLLVGALTFIPSLALGPIVEHLQLHTPGGILP